MADKRGGEHARYSRRKPEREAGQKKGGRAAPVRAHAEEKHGIVVQKSRRTAMPEYHPSRLP